MKALENHFYGKNSRFQGKKRFKTMKKALFLPQNHRFSQYSFEQAKARWCGGSSLCGPEEVNCIPFMISQSLILS